MERIHERISEWTTDKIIAVGLVLMGLISIAGYIVYAIRAGTATGTEIPMAIVSGLTGYLGRGAMQDRKAKHAGGEMPADDGKDEAG